MQNTFKAAEYFPLKAVIFSTKCLSVEGLDLVPYFVNFDFKNGICRLVQCRGVLRIELIFIIHQNIDTDKELGQSHFVREYYEKEMVGNRKVLQMKRTCQREFHQKR